MRAQHTHQTRRRHVGAVVAILMAATTGVGVLLGRAVAFREAWQLAGPVYRDLETAVTDLGRTTSVWIGFALIVVGGAVLASWKRFPRDRRIRGSMAAGAVLVAATGFLFAVTASLPPSHVPGSPPPAEARSVKNGGNRQEKRHRRHEDLVRTPRTVPRPGQVSTAGNNAPVETAPRSAQSPAPPIGGVVGSQEEGAHSKGGDGARGSSGRGTGGGSGATTGSSGGGGTGGGSGGTTGGSGGGGAGGGSGGTTGSSGGGGAGGGSGGTTGSSGGGGAGGGSGGTTGGSGGGGAGGGSGGVGDGGGGGGSGGSGGAGGGNVVNIQKVNEQTAESGSVSGGGTSGPATNNNESNETIIIG